MKDKLMTNYAKVLILINNSKFDFNGKSLIPLSQVEIAETIGITSITVNSIFKELKEDKLIEMEKHRYFITNKGIEIANKLNF